VCLLPYRLPWIGRNILVAEDNFINQKLVKQVLIRYGVTVELANNGLEAFEKRKSENYDLIFMDIQMPVMDGVEATHEIINYEVEEKLEHIPIVALTANALNGDRERFISEGLDEYIPKPIETNELLYILKKFLKVKTKEDEELETLTEVEVLESTKKETLIKENTGLISILEEVTPLIEDPIEEIKISDKEKKILILKKNPLEAQILSKVISNLNYDIEIVNKVNQLETYIQEEKYDILLIDKEIEQFNHKILEKQHSKMNVIMLSLAKSENDHYNTNLIKEIHVGIIKRDKIEQLIKKYRR
jgi:CheY-like chemotaxis protein